MSEIVTKINASLLLHEHSGGIRFGTDALILAYFASQGAKKGFCVDLGTGSGVIPLLLLATGSRANFKGIEISPIYALLAKKNSEVNGFGARFEAVCGNVLEIDRLVECGSASAVVTNPPYMPVKSGETSKNSDMSRARREENGNIADFCKSAAYCLKNGGHFYAVYRPDRAAELICSMRESGIEPKKIRAVVSYYGARPSLLLAEGIKSAAEGMIYEKDLCIYADAAHKVYSEEMQEIYRYFSNDNRSE